MKKGALLISGQLRNVEKGYEFISKNIMEGYDFDVFVHGWHDKNANPKEKFSKWWNAYPDGSSDIKFLELYRPKKYIFEPQKEVDLKNYNADEFEGPYRVWATLSMFYSIQKTNELKQQQEIEQGFKYDFVVRTRTDLLLLNKLDFHAEDIDKFIYLKDDCKHDETGMNDHFAFTNSINMDKYCSCFDNIENLVLNYKSRFCPEILLGKHVKLCHKLKTKNMSLHSGIIRDKDNIDNNWRSWS